MNVKIVIDLKIDQVPYESQKQIRACLKTWVEDSCFNGTVTSGLDSGVDEYRLKITRGHPNEFGSSPERKAKRKQCHYYTSI